MRQLGVVPSYYLRYFYQHDAVVDELRGAPTRAQVVAGVEQQLLEMYADPTLSKKPDLLAQRGGAYYSESAVNLMSSLVRDTGDVQVVNVRNAGTLPFLSDDAVIEMPAVVDARGATPLPAAPVAPLFAGLIAHVTAYEELAVDAAIRGGRDRVFKALLAHPLVGPDRSRQRTDRPVARREPRVPAMGGHASVTDRPAAAVLAIDGGGSKTDVALVAGDGTVLARSRGPRAVPEVSGMAETLRIIADLVTTGGARLRHDARRRTDSPAHRGVFGRRRPPVRGSADARCAVGPGLECHDQGRQRYVRDLSSRNDPALGRRRRFRSGHQRGRHRP